jgi:peptidoglycan/xylan/chitin deacetylase (PgdA/CDA1 family)
MSGVILMYHRVAAPRQDAYGLAVAPERFAEHVEHLVSGRSVVPLRDMLSPSRADRVAITFDDGYEDNAVVAAPVLAAAGLPATYFITTSRLGGKRFWWDRLAAGLLGPHPLPDGIDVGVGGQELWLALQDADARRASLRFLHRRLRPRPPGEVQSAVDDLLRRLDVPAPPEDERSMSHDQLKAMAGLPMVEIGAHTRTHLQLAGQPEAVQRAEVLGSVADLETLLDRPVRSFAYPFGTARAVGALAPGLARDAGCVLACSTEDAGVSRRPDRYRLPRLNVQDWTGTEFARQVARVAGS